MDVFTVNTRVRYNFVKEKKKNALNETIGAHDVKATLDASLLLCESLHLIRRAIEICRSGNLGFVQSPI